MGKKSPASIGGGVCHERDEIMANNDKQSDKISEAADTTSTVVKKGLAGGIKNTAVGAVNAVGNVFGKAATAIGVPKQAVSLVLAITTVVASVSIYDASVNNGTGTSVDDVNAEAACVEQYNIINTQMAGVTGLSSDEQVARGKTIYKYLHSLGYTDEAIAGVLSNATADSGLQSERYEGDDITDAFGLLRNHHTNWNAYTEALFDIYTGKVKSDSYSAGAVNMFMGSDVSGSAYQTAGAFYKEHTVEAKKAYKVDSDLTDDELYLPGFGLWMLSGTRADNMFYFANCQSYPVDNDSDGNNDVIFETPLQIAYLYYEDYADINEWGKNDFYGAKTLLINRNNTYGTNNSMTDPNKWEVVRCIKAKTQDTTVYQYYRIFIKEEIDKISPDSKQSCPYNGVYKGSDGNTLDASDNYWDVPQHDVVQVKYTISLTPVTYTFTVKNGSETTRLENILKSIEPGVSQEDIENIFTSNNYEYKKYESNTYYSNGVYDNTDNESEYKNYEFTTTAYWNWICNNVTTEDIYIPDDTALRNAYTDYDEALRDYNISKKIVEKIQDVKSSRSKYDSDKKLYDDAENRHNTAVINLNEAKDYRNNFNSVLVNEYNNFMSDYSTHRNDYITALNKWNTLDGSSDPNQKQKVKNDLINSASDLFSSIYNNYYVKIYNDVYCNDYYNNDDSVLEKLLSKQDGDKWEEGFVDDMARMVTIVYKMRNDDADLQSWIDTFSKYAGPSANSINVKSYVDNYYNTDVKLNDMNTLVGAFNTCLHNVIAACFGGCNDNYSPEYKYKSYLIKRADDAISKAKEDVNNAFVDKIDREKVKNTSWTDYSTKYYSFRNFYHENCSKLSKEKKELWNNCFNTWLDGIDNDNFPSGTGLYTSLSKLISLYGNAINIRNSCIVNVSDKREAFWEEVDKYKTETIKDKNGVSYTNLSAWETNREKYKTSRGRDNINYSLTAPFDQKYMQPTQPRGFDTWWYQYNGTVSGKFFQNIVKSYFKDIEDPFDTENHDESTVYHYVNGPERFVEYHHRYQIRWKDTDYSNYDGDSDLTDGYRGFLTKASSQTTDMFNKVYSDPDTLTTLQGVDFPYIQYQDGEDIAYENAVWFYKHWKDRDFVSEDSTDFQNHVATARYWYYLIRMNDWATEESDTTYEDYYKKRITSMLPDDDNPLTPWDLGSMYDEHDKMCGITALDNSSIAQLAANLAYPYSAENYSIHDIMSKAHGYYQAIHCTELYAAVYNTCVCVQQYKNGAEIKGPDKPIYSSPGSALWTVVHASGRDDDFPINLSDQAVYLNNNSDKGDNVDTSHKWKFVGTIKKNGATNSNDEIALEDVLKKLKPGDICINDDKAFIFIGLNTALTRFSSYYDHTVDASYAICTAFDNKEDDPILGTGLTCIIEGDKAESISPTNNPIQAIVEKCDSEFKVYRSIYDNYQASDYYQVLRVADMSGYCNGMLGETIKYEGGSIGDIVKIGLLTKEDIEKYKEAFLTKSTVSDE